MKNGCCDGVHICVCIFLKFNIFLVFGFCRLEKLPSESSFRDLVSWWNSTTKGEKFYDQHAPRFPQIEEIKDTLNEVLEQEEIIIFKRNVTSVRAIQSSVKVDDKWYPRNQTCLLTLKWPVEDTKEQLVTLLHGISIERKFYFY